MSGDLSENELVGPIAPIVGNLSFTGKLYLHGNRLTGPIPPELGNMTKLFQVMRICSKRSKFFLAAMVHELYKTGMSENTFQKLAQTDSCFCTSNGITFPRWDTLLRIGKTSSHSEV